MLSISIERGQGGRVATCFFGGMRRQGRRAGDFCSGAGGRCCGYGQRHRRGKSLHRQKVVAFFFGAFCTVGMFSPAKIMLAVFADGDALQADDVQAVKKAWNGWICTLSHIFTRREVWFRTVLCSRASRCFESSNDNVVLVTMLFTKDLCLEGFVQNLG